MVHKTSLKGVERPTLLYTAIGTHYFRLCAMYLYIILLIDSVVQQSCDFFCPYLKNSRFSVIRYFVVSHFC